MLYLFLKKTKKPQTAICLGVKWRSHGNSLKLPIFSRTSLRTSCQKIKLFSNFSIQIVKYKFSQSIFQWQIEILLLYYLVLKQVQIKITQNQSTKLISHYIHQYSEFALFIYSLIISKIHSSRFINDTLRINLFDNDGVPEFPQFN